ncbi:MAG: hypothetical protein JJE05_05040 [Actinobacteria bacterium]|nr:hypothetical protein [Actinomycetota bacterium]
MRGRLGVLIGFGAGYVLGAKAGKERYVQLRRLYDNLLDSPAVRKATGTAKGVASEGVSKVTSAVKGDGTNGSRSGLTVAPPPG